MKLSVVPAVLFASLVGQAMAQDAGSARPVIHDQRPDYSRGWMVVSKASYWPLCYESLDRMEEAKTLIGSDDKEAIAESLEKCSSWLSLAASAAMTDGTAGVVEASELFQDAANAIRDGEAWSDTELSDLITLGLVVTAKSHVIRADRADMDYKAPRATTATKKPTPNVSDLVKEATKEIAQENIAKAVAQYRYEATESQRHLVAAQEYLRHAATAGNFELSKEVAATVPELTAKTPEEMSSYVEDELRTRIATMRGFIAERRAELKVKLAARL